MTQEQEVLHAMGHHTWIYVVFTCRWVSSYKNKKQPLRICEHCDMIETRTVSGFIPYTFYGWSWLRDLKHQVGEWLRGNPLYEEVDTI